jgi:phenylacetate-coenzyme A ligase PaaK-like adenylate-forming protein
VLQEDGYGRIIGRLKDMIIRIGDKIFPVEIEEFFTGHPDILEAQVKTTHYNKINLIVVQCICCTTRTHSSHQNISCVKEFDAPLSYSRKPKRTKPRGLSPQAKYTDRLSDRRLSAKLVANLADRGCRVVSATIPPQSLISVF